MLYFSLFICTYMLSRTDVLMSVCLRFVQRGTALLLEHLAGSLASTISVSTHLDIAPQHHLFMKGRNGSNIKHITQRTGAQIHFPDPNSLQKKSTVYIQGTIESVCLARQYLMVCDLSMLYLCGVLFNCTLKWGQSMWRL